MQAARDDWRGHRRDDLREKFQAADKDGDHALNLAEAQVAFPKLAESFGSLDTDNDGKLTPRGTARAASAALNAGQNSSSGSTSIDQRTLRASGNASIAGSQPRQQSLQRCVRGRVRQQLRAVVTGASLHRRPRRTEQLDVGRVARRRDLECPLEKRVR